MEESALNAARSQRPPFEDALADRVITGGAPGAPWADRGAERGIGLDNARPRPLRACKARHST
jgi:hypothetical protein